MRRDKYGIIIQTATEDVNYEDGGDSAFSTGLMAFSGSPQDAMLMHEFIVKGKLVRHPYQPKWDDPKETSRDQVLAFFAGLCGGQSLGPERYLVVESCLFYAKRCFVMAKKAGVVESVTLTGGCAKNEGLKQAIEKVLKVKVVELPIDPQLMGALGAAEYARQKGMAR